MSELLYSLSMTLKDGIYPHEHEKLAKFKLLILDDFRKVVMSAGEKSILLDIVEDRAGTLSAIIVGRRPYNDEYSYIDNPVNTDAALDRLSRDRHHIKPRGAAFRRREASRDNL